MSDTSTSTPTATATTPFTEMIDALYRDVGCNLRHMRRQAGLTQADLAAQCGVSRAAVCNIEIGRQRVALHVLVAMAQALAIDVADVMGDVPLLTIAEADQSPAFRVRLGRMSARVPQLDV